MSVFGLALLWIALAAAVTVRRAREDRPFSLTWWSSTFPVGTVVTGGSALALPAGSVVLGVLAVAFLVGLLGAWVPVAFRTTRGGARGQVFLLPAAASV